MLKFFERWDVCPHPVACALDFNKCQFWDHSVAEYRQEDAERHVGLGFSLLRDSKAHFDARGAEVMIGCGRCWPHTSARGWGDDSSDGCRRFWPRTSACCWRVLS